MYGVGRVTSAAATRAARTMIAISYAAVVRCPQSVSNNKPVASRRAPWFVEALSVSFWTEALRATASGSCHGVVREMRSTDSNFDGAETLSHDGA